MRFSRHAKNRLRLIKRGCPHLTMEEIIDAAKRGELLGRDRSDDRRRRIHIRGIVVVLVIDPSRRVVITLWRER